MKSAITYVAHFLSTGLEFVSKPFNVKAKCPDHINKSISSGVASLVLLLTRGKKKNLFHCGIE